MVNVRSGSVVGVLAVQGDFEKHLRVLASRGTHAHEVRTAGDLEGLSALVIPGGESTTMTRVLEGGLREPLLDFCRKHPVWGTCAGMIMLGRPIPDPRVRTLSLMDVEVERNGFGRQVHSFEADLRVAEDLGEAEKPLRGVFIRAPRITRMGKSVRPLVWLDDEPVCVQEGHILASSFHPELTDDARLHVYFLSLGA